MANNNYFYLSGLISFSFFIFFLSLFFYMGYMSSKVNQYALEEDKYISIVIDFPVEKQTNNNASVPKQEESILGAEVVDVSDLFSDVWTKNIPKENTPKNKINKIDNRIINKLKKETKTLKIKKTLKITQDMSNKDKINIHKEIKSKNSAFEVNKYLARINAIVYSYFNPPKDSQGYSVHTVIVLSPFGKVEDFRILIYSLNEKLNKECDSLKRRLKNVVFPVHPEGKKSRTKVILTSKE